MRVIAARELPVFFEAEQADRPDKDKLLQLIGSSSKGTLADKLRLLGVLTLRAADPSSAQLLTELEDALKACCADSPPTTQGELEAGLAGIKHMRQMQNFQQQAPSQVRDVKLAWRCAFISGKPNNITPVSFACGRSMPVRVLRRVGAASAAGYRARCALYSASIPSTTKSYKTCFVDFYVGSMQTAGILGQVHSLLTRSHENYVTRVVDK